MKNRSVSVIALLLIAVCLLAACGEGGTLASAPESSGKPGGSITIPVLPAAPAATQTPLPTMKLEPALTAPPTPTPTPIPTLGPYYEPTVRKSPWPEDCVEGSTIYFSAIAENCREYRWQLEKDHLILDWSDMTETFDGMIAAGINESYLVLGNVPCELDGWSVRCACIGSGNATVYTQSALITVRERTVKIHGIDRKTVKGTGNVSCYGAIIDFEGELWWVAEEYAGATFALMPNDADPSLGVREASFQVSDDGSVLLIIDGVTYRGMVAGERLGGFSAGAVVSEENSGEEKTVFFDYTAQSQRWENWQQIWLQIMLEFPVEPEAPVDETATAPSEGQEAPVPEETPLPAETASPEESAAPETSPREELSEEEPEPVPTESRLVELVLTRMP